jgi:hypothetical protein
MRCKRIELHQAAFWFRLFSVVRDDPLGIAVCVLRERLYGHVYW